MHEAPAGRPRHAHGASDEAPTTRAVRTEVVYSGRVQGVGFRVTAMGIARRFAVTGWVRNEHDGSVHLQAQGEPGTVRAFLDAVASHQASLIGQAEEQPAAVVPGERTFEVQR